MKEQELLDLVEQAISKYRRYSTYEDIYQECVLAALERQDSCSSEELTSIVTRRAYEWTNFEDKLIPVSPSWKNRKALSAIRKGKNLEYDLAYLETLLVAQDSFEGNLDTTYDEDQDAALDKMILEEDQAFLQTCVKLFLTEHERNILTTYLEDSRTMEQIADSNGTTKQSVSQVIKSATDKIRKIFKERDEL